MSKQTRLKTIGFKDLFIFKSKTVLDCVTSGLEAFVSGPFWHLMGKFACLPQVPAALI